MLIITPRISHENSLCVNFVRKHKQNRVISHILHLETLLRPLKGFESSSNSLHIQNSMSEKLCRITCPPLVQKYLTYSFFLLPMTKIISPTRLITSPWLTKNLSLAAKATKRTRKARGKDNVLLHRLVLESRHLGQRNLPFVFLKYLLLVLFLRTLSFLLLFTPPSCQFSLISCGLSVCVLVSLITSFPNLDTIGKLKSPLIDTTWGHQDLTKNPYYLV